MTISERRSRISALVPDNDAVRIGFGGQPSTSGGGGDNYDRMEARVAKLEDSMTDIKVVLGKIETRLESMDRHLATKADVEAISGEVKSVRSALDGKLGSWEFIRTSLVLMGLGISAVALIAANWPRLAPYLSI